MDMKLENVCIRNEYTTIVEELFSDRFYLSGYETIIMNNTADAVQSLIYSTLSFEQKVLLLKSGDYKDVINFISEQKDIFTTSDIELSNKGLQNIELVLDTQKNISTLMLCIDNKTFTKRELLIQLSEICDITNTELIIYDTSITRDNLQYYLKSRTSYILFPNINNHDQSLIIAQRRSLVKTEGISSSFTHNLYNTWQNTLNGRQKNIRPMLSY